MSEKAGWIGRVMGGAGDSAGGGVGGGTGVKLWPASIIRKSGVRMARRALHVKYRSVQSPVAAAATKVSLAASDEDLEVEPSISCFCRKARRKEREGEGTGDPKLYLQEALLERKLPELDMRQLVDLPQGLDYNEWLASHTLALFDHVNLIYGTISEFCTANSCPDMLGPGGRTYPWYDEKGKKSRVAAPQYIDYVMTFTQKTVSDETIFPTKYANEFPSSFESIVRKIMRLLFHVVAHVYAAHFREVALLRLHSHLHLTFAHLTALHRRFGLIEHKETEVLRDLEVALRLTDEPPSSSEDSLSLPSLPAPPPPSESPARRACTDAPIVTQPLAGAAAGTA